MLAAAIVKQCEDLIHSRVGLDHTYSLEFELQHDCNPSAC